MATIDIRKQHGTSLEEASVKTKDLFAAFMTQRPEVVSSVEWNAAGTEGVAKGRGFQGHFQVTDHEVVVAIDLALLARPLKGRITATLSQRLDGAFDA